MDLKRKILRLEGVLIGRAGLPQWAIKVAEESIKARQLYRLNQPNLEAIERAIMREDPAYKPKPREPHPISEAETEEGFAADLLTKFRTKQAYEEWQRQRYAEGCAKMMQTLKRLKGEQGDAA